MRHLPLLLLAASLAALPGCAPKEQPLERARDAVDDALDRRPAEKLRDAAEDAKDAAVEMKDEAQKSLEEAAR